MVRIYPPRCILGGAKMVVGGKKFAACYARRCYHYLPPLDFSSYVPVFMVFLFVDTKIFSFLMGGGQGRLL